MGRLTDKVEVQVEPWQRRGWRRADGDIYLRKCNCLKSQNLIIKTQKKTNEEEKRLRHVPENP